MNMQSPLRKLAGAAVAAASLLALGVPASAFAADVPATPKPIAISDSGKETIAITGISAAVKGHSFKAVRVGEYANAEGTADGNLTNVAVTTVSDFNEAATSAFTSVAGAGLDPSYAGNPIGAVSSKWLGYGTTGDDTTSNSGTASNAWGKNGKLRAFVTNFSKEKALTSAFDSTSNAEVTSAESGANTTVTLTGLNPGVYVVKDVTPTSGAGKAADYTNAIPMLVSTGVTSGSTVYNKINGTDLGVITMKNDTVPSIVKTLDSSKSNDASIGGKLHYQLSSKVPLTTGFDHYIFTMTDTPKQAGLSYNNDAVVTVGSQTLSKSQYNVIVDTDAANNTKYVVFDLSSSIRSFTWQDKITVTYSMTVNDNAQGGSLGNGVTLSFSNDSDKQPTSDKPTISDGSNGSTDNGLVNPSDPGNGSVDTVTDKPDAEHPNANSTAYLRSFTLANKDKTSSAPLQGTFQVSQGDTKAAAPIKFLQLSDGSYKKAAAQGSPSATADLKPAQDGTLKVDGLSDGTYTVNQTAAPAGYSDMFKPSFTVTLSGDSSDPTISVATNTGDIWGLVEERKTATNTNDGTNAIVVFNVTSISSLPMTGGAGVLLAVVVALLLLVVAVALMIVKRRQAATLAGLR